MQPAAQPAPAPNPGARTAAAPPPPGNGRPWRFPIQSALRALALALFIAMAWPLAPWPAAALVPPASSPFILAGAALATRMLTAAALVGLPFAILMLVRPRGFCRFVCPVGSLIDLSGSLASPFRRRTPSPGPGCQSEPAPRASLGSAAARFKSVSPGQWIALLTLGGAVVGWPLFLWLDPMALFSAFFGSLHHPRSLPALVAATGLPAVLLLSLLRRNLWCGRLCPLGGLQDLSTGLQNQLRRQTPVNAAPANGLRIARRSAFTLGLAALGALLARRVLGARPKPLRPPGAAAEPDFAARCVRCGTCVRVCPSQLLQPDAGQHGVAGLLAPVLRFEDKYCLENCRRCAEVCPSGAIRPFTLAEKPKAAIGRPALDYSRCRLSHLGSDCTGCLNACPYGAITIVDNENDYRTRPVVSPGRCNGCGACEVACPATPRALVVLPS